MRATERLDAEIERRYGIRIPEDGARDPIVADWPHRRSVLWALTALYFASLWFGVAPFFVTMGYFALTYPRWKEKGFTYLLLLYLFLGVSIEKAGGLAAEPLIVQFVAIAPLVLVCILPPRSQFLPKGHPAMGRAAFILCVLPYLILLGSLYWPGLADVLRRAWMLVALPIEEPPHIVGLLVAPLAALVGPRLRDMFGDRAIVLYCVGLLIAILVLRMFVLDHSHLDPAYAPVLDLLSAAALIALCVWPSQLQRNGEGGGATSQL